MVMNIENFIRESMKRNEVEARSYLLEEQKKKIQTLSNANGIPPRFKKTSFDNYNKSYNYKAYKACLDFVDSFPDTRGLLFLGPVGLGKTHLAASIVHELNKQLYSTYFGNVFDIINFVKSTYSKDSKLTEIEAIEIMTKKIDLLLIDDLGKEPTTEHNLGLLYNIINKLYENEKALVITTNVGSSELRNNLGMRGPAIISRISAMCTPITFTGKDMRISYER